LAKLKTFETTTKKEIELEDNKGCAVAPIETTKAIIV
jgi:hypothetical protein